MLGQGGTTTAAASSPILRGHQIFAICTASDGDPLRDGSFVGCTVNRLTLVSAKSRRSSTRLLNIRFR